MHVEDMEFTPRPADTSKRTARVMVAFGGGLALAASAVIGYFGFAQPLQLMMAAKQWHAASCQIATSAVVERKPTTNRMKDRSSFIAEISYRYVVAGQEYTGNRVRFTTMSSIYEGDAKALVRRYPRLATTPCWYDPANPSESVIDREVNADLRLNGLVPLGLFVVGLAMLMFSAFGDFSKVRVGGPVAPAGSPPFVVPTGVRGVVELLAERSAVRAPALVRGIRGFNPLVAIVVIVLFIASVVIYGYKTIVEFPDGSRPANPPIDSQELVVTQAVAQPVWIVTERNFGLMGFDMPASFGADVGGFKVSRNPRGCSTASLMTNAPQGAVAIIDGQQLVGIRVFSGRVETSQHVRIGSSETEVRQAYQMAAKTTTDMTPHELVIIPSVNDSTHRIVFTIGDGKVTSYRAGNWAAIQRREQC